MLSLLRQSSSFRYFAQALSIYLLYSLSSINSLVATLLQVVADSEHVIVLRDQDTVADLQSRLHTARRAVIFGNGGIALELVHALRSIEASPLCSALGRCFNMLQLGMRAEMTPQHRAVPTIAAGRALHRQQDISSQAIVSSVALLSYGMSDAAGGMGHEARAYWGRLF